MAGQSVMRDHKKSLFMLLAICAAGIIAVAVNPLHSQERGSKSNLPEKEQQRREFESQFPIAELNPAEVSSPEEQAKRRAKSKRYGGQPNSIHEDMYVTVSTRHLAVGLPALPVQQNNA